MLRFIAIAVVCTLACTAVTPTPARFVGQQLLIISKGSPPVRVVINGAEIVTVTCNGGAGIRPGENGAPPLPWDIKVSDQSTGRIVLEERIAELPRWLVIFRDSAGVSASPVSGPFIPCAAN